MITKRGYRSGSFCNTVRYTVYVKYTGKKIVHEILAAGSPRDAAFAQRFFKTGKGQYGEGDIFVGVSVPKIRTIGKKLYMELKDSRVPQVLKEIDILLKHKVHECRLAAVHILVDVVKRIHKDIEKNRGDVLKHVDTLLQYAMYYLENTAYINNWDIVDSSARDVVGGALYYGEQYKKVAALPMLQKLSQSKILWERRIAAIAPWFYTQKNEYVFHLKVLEMVDMDSEDLMHKAVGWMLREIGKRDIDILRTYLQRRATKIPRTQLRYAIEKMSITERKKYMGM
ncbi:MAG: DNA alkylation repair protein [Candidatus Taylorbacteria bacterium]|nr:DNA alkylation repair protein [Candidatus Taylorbacteria bacterium]